MLAQVAFWLAAFRSVPLGLEVEVERVVHASDLERQRGRADLARSEERHGWRFLESLLQFWEEPPRQFPCM